MTSHPRTSRVRVLDADRLRAALALRDLTDPGRGPHAMQLLLAEVETAGSAATGLPPRRHRTDPVVSVADNYDRLRYPPGAAARGARHTRYLTPTTMLRAHTTAAVPGLLADLAARAAPETLLSCPGLCYRRDVIDRLHVGEPHQLDLWRVRPSGPALTAEDLHALLGAVLAAAVPGRAWRTVPATHPYTVDGREIQARDGAAWVEVGECGLAHPDVLGAAGLPADASGLAVGLGLDRLLMLRKGIDDIRLLRSADPRIAGQLRDLAPYRPVSAMPPIRRDLSIAVEDDVDAEELGDRVRTALGADARRVEEVRIVAETPWALLPPAARARLGLRDGQKNVLLRVVLRDLERTLTDREANVLRDRLLASLLRPDRDPPT